jgi:aspartyl-tRNA(Asn)/glutamyl-tRNA(Gln) amidotransferase subunit A
MTSANLPGLDIAQLRQLLQKRTISAAELIRALRQRIEQIEPNIRAYLSLDFDEALAEAAKARLDLPLGGIPIAIKDLISVAGQPCTCGSNILAGYRASYDATVVSKLRAAGAIPLGRTNMDEFAMGSSTENSNVGPTRNPWDITRVPGGSSGGSAAAVASDMAVAALGTDTGGSIRQPAAMCGVVGLKPTYGRVSRYGVTAFASSLDQVGSLTKTVRDAALMLSVIGGHDALDSTSAPVAIDDYLAELDSPLPSMRIGRPREYFVDGVNREVRAAVDAAAQQFVSLGAEVVDVSLPHTDYAIAAYYIIATAEASANLARFDGVRYGVRAANPRDLRELYVRTRGEGFGPEVKRRVLLGTHVLSTGYYDAYYLRAQKVRELIRRDFVNAFAEVDALISPTAPDVAFQLGERAADPLQMYLADVFTNAANLAGICAISLCGGFARADGVALPIGLQLLGKPFDESRLLRLAHAYEQSTDWHRMKPVLS